MGKIELTYEATKEDVQDLMDLIHDPPRVVSDDRDTAIWAELQILVNDAFNAGREYERRQLMAQGGD